MRWQQYNQQAWPWWLLFSLCVGLEAGALYFQQVLQYYPCEMCIYTRVWIMLIAFAALLQLWLRHLQHVRLIGQTLLIALMIGLALQVYDLLAVEKGFASDGACAFKANFWSWAPLDQWWPAMFEVGDFCQATPEVWLGISMAEGLAAFVLISLLLLLIYWLSDLVGWLNSRRH